MTIRCFCVLYVNLPNSVFLFLVQTGTAGGNGGYVAGLVTLTAGQTLQTCVGLGGAGGSTSAGLADRGGAGANGFVIVTIVG